MGSVVETPLGVVGENVVHMARLDALFVLLPESHVQQIAVVLHEHGAHGVVAQQKGGMDYMSLPQTTSYGVNLNLTF